MKSNQNNKRAHEAGRIVLWCVLGLMAFGAAAALFAVTLADNIKRERSEQTAEIVVNGAGTVAVIDHEEFFETDTPAEGIARARDAQHTACDSQPTRDIGSPDWNLNTRLYGANGLTAEAWEIDLLTRIVSREVCGCSETCWVAICDAILNRVACGFWGSSIYEVVSAVEQGGAWAFTTWPDVYDGKPIELYDEIRAVCEQEFYNGVQFPAYAKYFNLYGYAAWDGAVPCYEIDGVFFSASEWLEGWR